MALGIGISVSQWSDFVVPRLVRLNPSTGLCEEGVARAKPSTFGVTNSVNLLRHVLNT